MSTYIFFSLPKRTCNVSSNSTGCYLALAQPAWMLGPERRSLSPLCLHWRRKGLAPYLQHSKIKHRAVPNACTNSAVIWSIWDRDGKEQQHCATSPFHSAINSHFPWPWSPQLLHSALKEKTESSGGKGGDKGRYWKLFSLLAVHCLFGQEQEMVGLLVIFSIRGHHK